MKILIIPMAAMAETHGPSSRCRLLAQAFKAAGMEVCTCMARDVNYKELEGIENYFLDVPMPMGLPKIIATRTFPVAQKLGITARKRVDSFDQVLRYTGNLDQKYLRKSVACIQRAIREFKPDAVYSEFNVSAMIAAKKEGVPLCATVSFPTQHEYAHKAGLENGLNKILRELDLPRVDSALKLFDWADVAFCPSIRELEPIDKPNVFFCGSLKQGREGILPNGKRNKIIVYVGNGTVSAKKTLEVVRSAFKEAPYEVYVASAALKQGNYGNVRVAPRWDFDKLLKEAVLFINHGGQNSIVDGLINGVAQIVLPGNVFERKYNAKTIADHRAGIVMDHKDFDPEHLKAAAAEALANGEMAENAYELGRKLTGAGGVNIVVNVVKEITAARKDWENKDMEMNAERMDKLRKEWEAEEKIAHIHGWDFSHIHGRYDEEEDLPWDYKKIIEEYRTDDMKLFDYDTGGGEFLLSLGHPYENTAATEGFPPNVELCKETLLPLGIDFKPCDDEKNIPFEDDSFDLFINRHGSFDPKEAYRLLKPEGVFITQQVGGRNDRELVEMVLPGVPMAHPELEMATQKKMFEEAGFEVIRAEEAFRPIRFRDVGAFVWFAHIIEWEFPGFSVEKCFDALLRMQDVIDRTGAVEGTIHRYLIVAKKHGKR